MTTPSSPHRPLAGLARRLVDEHLLPEADVHRAIAEAALSQVSLATWLLERAVLDSERLARAISAEFGLPLHDLGGTDLTRWPRDTLPAAMITRYTVLPLQRHGRHLRVAMADPAPLRALDDIRFHTGCSVEPVLVERRALERAIARALAMTASVALRDAHDAERLQRLAREQAHDQAPDSTTVDATAHDDMPVVGFVNTILLDAVQRAASDIHFEPYERRYRVRLRVDGLLRPAVEAPAPLGTRIASRLKVMGGLDIAERRVPQDGRIKLKLPDAGAIDLRISTLPTLYGEKIVLRILDASAAHLDIDALGLDPGQKRGLLEAIHKPHGMVLVTGPTGSGKTVSLYTALNILNTERRNISTVEDPVEIRLDGINQVQHNSRRGMTFATALRALLRQDPDVIMVGEIRDLETAEIALKAAQTGHMVLSTLHTNDAPQSITRLANMGIAPYNITASLGLVIAQRLARRLHACKHPVQLPQHALRAAGFDAQDIAAGLTLYEPTGCEHCDGGYRGRVGIYQVMPMSEPLQAIVLQGGDARQLAAAARAQGVADLRTSALRKVREGITSLAEVDRVTRT